MASVLRIGLGNINPTGLLVGLCKVTSKCRNVAVTQVARISSREIRQDRPPRPPPFDWRHKKYHFWHYAFDPMEERFDDNTKVVVVEGMPAVGKDNFAKKLAEELDMKYMPPPSFDDYLINPYGFDSRSINHKLPVDAQFFDIQTWLEDPTGRNSAAMQLYMFGMRCESYMIALTEVLSTGTGVVLQRCPYTDSIFVQAMRKSDHISKGGLDFYRAANLGTLHMLMRPHLIVYLDAPVSVVKDNIKKRNIPYEVNSKALTDKYLHDLESLYKDQYLREMTNHSHLLIYDWKEEGDISAVVEDIERLDFDIKDGSIKFYDWKYDHISDLKQKRWTYQHDQYSIMVNINVSRFDVPEMLTSAQDWETREEELAKFPELLQHAPGFNPLFDKGVLFKTQSAWEDELPRNQQLKKQQ